MHKQYEGMKYKPKVIPVFSPAKWGKGKWVDDENGLDGKRYTGKLNRDILGYQVVIMAHWVDGKETIAQTLGDRNVIFDTREYAAEWFNAAYTMIQGTKYKPSLERYPLGEVLQYEL